VAHWLTELETKELLAKLERAVGAGVVSTLAQREHFLKMQETLVGDK
jgi:hypothetical protein